MRPAVSILVAGQPLKQPVDRLLLLLDLGTEVGDRLTLLRRRGMVATTVVAAPAGGAQVLLRPEQVRVGRAREDVVDCIRDPGATRAPDLADVAVAGEHGTADSLPGRGRVAAIAHTCPSFAAAAEAPDSSCSREQDPRLGQCAGMSPEVLSLRPTRVEPTTLGRTPPQTRRERRCETTVPLHRPPDRPSP
jgi:hypothetical protein